MADFRAQNGRFHKPKQGILQTACKELAVKGLRRHKEQRTQQ